LSDSLAHKLRANSLAAGAMPAGSSRSHTVSINQRSIYQGIAHNIPGSSNRGFISLDPERQPRIVTQPPKAKTATAAASEFRTPSRPGTIGSVTGSSRR
jgi:hypothetical protein